MMQLEAGVVLGGCEIIHLLGRGGMGNVYLARQRTLNRLVAVKVIRPDVDANQLQAFHARFEREARALATFDHPHVLPIYDFGMVTIPEGEGTVTVSYLVMAYVTGGSLADYLSEQGDKLSPQDILAILEQIAEGLQHAHDKGIIHRDLKPQNILRYPDGRLVIADFGLAHSNLTNDGFTTVKKPGTEATSSAKETSGSMGTPRYMAPEHLRGRAEYRSDLYSLGIMLYHMLTGVFPFEGEPIQVAIAHLQEAPPPLRTHCPDLPEAVEAVVLRALEKNPADRFQSARELVGAFRAAALGVTVPAPRAPVNLATPDSANITFSPPPIGIPAAGAMGAQMVENTPEFSVSLAGQAGPGDLPAEKSAHPGNQSGQVNSIPQSPVLPVSRPREGILAGPGPGAWPWFRRKGLLLGIGSLVIVLIGVAALAPLLQHSPPTVLPFSKPTGQFSAPAEGSTVGNVVILQGRVRCVSGLTSIHLEQNGGVFFDQRQRGEQQAPVSFQLNLTGQDAGPQELTLLAQCQGSTTYWDTGARLHLINDSATGSFTTPAPGTIITGSAIHLRCTVSFPAGIGSIHISANPQGHGWRLLLNKRYQGEKQITLDTVLDLSSLSNGEIQLGLDATTTAGKSRLGIDHLFITKQTP